MVESEYAKAIYELAVEENKIVEFSDAFQAVKSTLNEEFVNILTSPFINKEKKKEMVSKVYASLDATFINFLYVLIDHNRFAVVQKVAEEYELLVLNAKGIIKVELISAVKLTAAKINMIKDTLSAKYAGKTIELKNTVNPELIGGVQIVTNMESLDASIKGTLNKLKESL